MGSVLLALIMVLVLAALVFGVIALLSGEDPGLAAAEPDGRAMPLPTNRSLAESDVQALRFDTALRGYRMAQVDRALRRTAYDLGYKDEMIAVLEAEVIALRDGRMEDAELLRKAREAASDTATGATPAVAHEADGDAGEAYEDSDGADGGADRADAAVHGQVEEAEPVRERRLEPSDEVATAGPEEASPNGAFDRGGLDPTEARSTTRVAGDGSMAQPGEPARPSARA